MKNSISHKKTKPTIFGRMKSFFIILMVLFQVATSSLLRVDAATYNVSASAGTVTIITPHTLSPVTLQTGVETFYNQTPLFSGTATNNGATVTLALSGGAAIGTATVASNAWYASPTAPILNGFHTVCANGAACKTFAVAEDGGNVSRSFAPGGTGTSYGVMDIARQSDGKFIVAGFFTQLDGLTYNRIGRITANGKVDTTFTPYGGADLYIDKLFIQSDDKIIIGGDFTTFSGVSRNEIARLNANGSLDTTFQVGAGLNNNPAKIMQQADGKLLILGTFSAYSGYSAQGAVRLSTTGLQDKTFTGLFTPSPTYFVLDSVLQPDGKIVAVGQFSTYNGSPKNNIVRLTTTGWSDQTFLVGSAFNSLNAILSVVVLQPDGKILVGGQFTSYSGASVNGLVRLNANGTIDTGFNVGAGFPGGNGPQAIELQSDGSMYIGGGFTGYNGMQANGLLRLTSTGLYDVRFNAGEGIDVGSVNVIKVFSGLANPIIGGSYSSYNGNPTSIISSIAANPTYLLNYQLSGANGTLVGATLQSVAYGDNGTAVTIIPNTGYTFSGWSDGVLTATRTDVGYDNIVVTGYIRPITPAPGGVYLTNTLWLRADSGSSTSIDAASVSSWKNVGYAGSGELFLGSPAAGQRPTYRATGTGLINFNPSMSFTGAGFFSGNGNFGISGSNLFTMFAVVRKGTGSVGGDYTIVGTTPGTTGFSLRLKNSVASPNQYIFQGTGSKTGNIALFTSGSVNIAGTWRFTGTQYGVMTNGRRDGGYGTIGLGNNGIIPGRNLSIGSGAGGNPYRGEITEVAIHSGYIDTGDRVRIQAYFAIKYGITLVDGDYVDSSSDLLWDQTVNFTYTNNMTFIGRDDNSDLMQKQSKSTSASGLVTIGYGGIYSSNINNPNKFSSDLSFVAFGDDAGSINWNNVGASTSNRKIMTRKFKVAETTDMTNYTFSVPDNTSTAAEKLPGVFGTVYLTVDTDTNFTAGATQYEMTLSGTDWIVSGVDVDSGNYFTFEYEPSPAPGGLTGDIYQRFDAASKYVTTGVGSTVSRWKDRIHGFDVFTDPDNGQPTYIGAVNYNPTLYFNGNASLQSSGVTNAPAGSGLTWAGVMQQNDLSYGGTIFQYRNVAAGVAEFPALFADPTTQRLYLWNTANTFANRPLTSNSINTGDINVVDASVMLRNTGSVVMGLNGVKTTGSLYITSYGSFGVSIGGYVGTLGANYGIQGYLPEFSTFSGQVTGAKLQRVQSYYAIKYGTTLSGGSVDYVDTTSSVLWNAIINSGYKNNITVIGRDDNQGLNQKQSRASNAGGLVAMGLGDGLTTYNAQNTNTFGIDRSFLAFSNNNSGALAWGTGTTALLNRTWRVEETNDDISGLTISLPDDSSSLSTKLPVDGGKVYMLIDTDADFTVGATSYQMTLSGTDWYVTGINLDDSQFFTFSTVPALPQVNLYSTNGYPSTAGGIAEQLPFKVYAILSGGTSSTGVLVTLGVTGDATLGVDYIFSGFTITIPAGQLTGIFYMTGIADNIVEAPGEYARYYLAGVVNADTGTITSGYNFLNDTTAPTQVNLSLDTGYIAENNGPARIKVTLSGGIASGDVSMNIAFLGGASAATYGDDYSFSSTSLTILSGQLTGYIYVTGVNDSQIEGNEFIRFAINNLDGAITGSLWTGTIVVVDDDVPYVNLSASPLSIAENGGVAQIFATLSGLSTPTYDIFAYYTLTGTASGGVDYTVDTGIITIGAGDASGYVLLTGLNDLLIEGNETITFSLTNVAASSSKGALSGNITSGTITIIDDDFLASSHYISYPLSGTVTTGSTIAIGGTGMSSTGFVLHAGTATGSSVCSGTTSATGVWDCASITLSSGANTFCVTPTGGSCTTIYYTPIIVVVPTLNLFFSTGYIAESGGVAQIFAILSGGVSATGVVVTIALSGTASAGLDYTLAPLTITIPAGQLTGVFLLTGINDFISEGSEAADFTLQSVANANTGTETTGSLIIVDDEMLTVNLSPYSPTIAENGGTGYIQAILNGGTSLSNIIVTINVAGSATLGSDYALTPLSLTIPAGQTSGYFLVTGINDLFVEGNETLTYALAGVTNATGGTLTTGTITIVDDDAVYASISLNTGNIGEASGVTVITAILTGGVSAGDVNFTFTFTGTATNGIDYIMSTGIITIPAGQYTGTLTITALEDIINEANERIEFTATTSDVMSGNIGGTTGVVRILDNDPPFVNLSVSTGYTREQDGDTMTITAYLSGGIPLGTDVFVTLAQQDSASEGLDYTMASHVIVIPAGQLTGTTTFTVLDDVIQEGNENVGQYISVITGGASAGSLDNITTTIMDNESLSVNLSISSASTTENGGHPTIFLILSGGVSATGVTVTLNLTGTATYGTDYALSPLTLTIPAGQTTIYTVLTGIDDNIREGDETVDISINSVLNANAGIYTSGTVLIIDDETTTVVSLTGGSTISENGGVDTLRAYISAGGLSVSPIIVYLSYTGTATNGVDYANITTITIPAGSTGVNFTLTGLDDLAVEGSETIFTTISSITGSLVALNGAQATVVTTLSDDDSYPSVNLSTSTASVSESGGTAHIYAVLTHTATTGVTVTIALSGSATYGIDYALTPLVVTIPAGQLTGTFLLTGIDDLLIEGSETVGYIVGSVTDALTGTVFSGTITLTDDDALPSNPTVYNPMSGQLLSGTASVTGTCTAGNTIIISGSNILPNPTTGSCAFPGQYSIPTIFTGNTTTGTITVYECNNVGCSTGTVVLPLIIDTKPPTIPTIISPAAAITVTGNALNVTGACEIGSTVILTGNFVPNPTTGTCGGGGTYSLPITLTTGDGIKNIYAIAKDTAGNTSTGFALRSIMLDTTPPLLTITAPTSGGVWMPTIQAVTGTSESGAYITITNSTGLVIGTGIVNASGVYSIFTNATGAFTTTTLTVKSCDALNNCITITIPVGVDADGDGNPTSIEDAGFNGGDGNGDGIPDSQQPDVAGTPNPILSGAYTTLQTSGGCTIVSKFNVFAESSIPVQDPSYSYPMGLNNFVLQCSATGETATVDVYYDKIYDTSSRSWRKYHTGTATYSDVSSIVSVSIGSKVVGGTPVTKVTFTITDGGLADEDNAGNKVIIDPSGPGVPIVVTPPPGGGGGGGSPTTPTPLKLHTGYAGGNTGIILTGLISPVAFASGDIFNPTITDGVCYTRGNTLTLMNSQTTTIFTDEYMRAQLMMFNYEMTRYNSIDPFRPFDNLTREEAAKIFSQFAMHILCRNPDLNTAPHYSDLSGSDQTLAPYVTLAYQLGLMKGANNTFRPFDKVTKEEIAAIVSRLMLDSYLPETNDNNRYSNYEKTATQLGLMTKAIVPGTPISRYDTTLMIWRAYRNQFYLYDTGKNSFVIENAQEIIDSIDK